MRTRFENLTRREKLAVILAAVAVAAVVLYALLISPAIDRSALLDRLIAQKERDLRELLVLTEEYHRLKMEEENIVRRLTAAGKTESPLAQLEELAKKAGLGEQIQQMKPLEPVATPRYSITPVQLRFREAGLKEVVAYLYEIEASTLPFQLRRLSIKSATRATGRLEVTMEVLTFSPSVK